MKTIIATALIAASIASAHAEDLLVPALVAHAADWSQTMAISESCHSDGLFHETNPILGECPDKADVTKYFVTSAAVMTAAHYLLPKEYAKWTDRVWVAVEVGAVAHNAAIGIRFSY